ncbi:MAG TPA: DMT family transporter [Allosphingosinicella sp.]|nr:DMT family transporter [Allosphingosinicella sp.]
MLRIASGGAFSLMSALFKLAATHGARLPEIFFYRALFGLPVILVWILPRHGIRAFAVNSAKAHIGRSTIGVVSMIFTFEALVLLPLAEATTIMFTGPIFATLLSWLILREHVGLHRWIAALVAFAGVVVVTRPGAVATAVAPLGIAVALGSALGTAGVSVTLRHLGGRESVAAIVFWFLTVCIAVGLVMVLLFGTPQSWSTLMILAAGALFGGIGQILMTASLQVAPVSVLTPFDYLQLLAALMLGWLLFGTSPTFNTVTGAVLIAGSGLYTALRERKRRRAPELPATQPLA